MLVGDTLVPSAEIQPGEPCSARTSHKLLWKVLPSGIGGESRAVGGTKRHLGRGERDSVPRTIPWRSALRSPWSVNAMWQKIFSRGVPGRVKRIAPQLDPLLHHAHALGVEVLGRIVFAEAAVRQRAKSQAAIGSIFRADLGLRSGDDAGEQVLLPLRFQNRQLARDLRADQPRAVFRRGHDAGRVVTHLRRKLRGVDAPLQGPCRVGNLFPVRRLDVVGIGQQVLAPAPAHRIIDVDGHGHVVFPRHRKRVADPLTRLLVGDVETKRPDGEPQFVPGVAGRADRP